MADMNDGAEAGLNLNRLALKMGFTLVLFHMQEHSINTKNRRLDLFLWDWTRYEPHPILI